jgi:FAD/FMN-containing dehydrogenase
MTPDLLPALRTAVGEAHVLTDGDLSAYTHDWRKRHHGQALAVVLPGCTEEVATVVKACAAAGVSIVPQGGNTGLVVGGVPDTTGQQVLLSLKRMHQVRAIDAANLTITVDAGCVLQAAQEAAAAQGFWLPLSLAAEGSCTIGGNLATNAGGTQVLRFGNTRELCLGLEVVTAQGDIWNGLTGLRKDNTGYDLRHLMIGSEGTLGIITAATLKLVHQPAAHWTAWAAVNTVDDAVRLLNLAQQRLGPNLTGYEMMGRFALQLVSQHFEQLRVPFADSPYGVLLESSDFESEDHARAQFDALLEAALEAQLITDAVVAESMQQAKGLWHIRESIPLAQAQEGLNIKHDISVPVSQIPAFVAATDAALVAAIAGVRLVNFGHLGDGNLHYNVQCPEGADGAAFLDQEEARINALVFDAVTRHGGSISAEHGVGSLKAHALPHYKSPVALGLMRSIKAALDPHNLLNPGRVLE